MKATYGPIPISGHHVRWEGRTFLAAKPVRHAKQFLPLAGDALLIRQIVDRILPLVQPEQVYVVTGAAYRDLVAQTLPEVPQPNILVEPVSRNAAPCIDWPYGYIEYGDAIAAID